MDNSSIYTICRNIIIACGNGDTSTIECLSKDNSNIRTCNYFEMMCDRLYYNNYDSSYLLSKIIECAEKYNCKINIYDIYDTDLSDYYLYVDWTYEKNKEILEYFLYLMKHNYDYSYFLVIRPKGYKTDELTIKKHIKYNKNSYIFNNNRKYEKDETPRINLYNICYMIIII